MQEVISFEIGGQTYKLTGNNKELTARAAHLVNNKYEIIKKTKCGGNNTGKHLYAISIEFSRGTRRNRYTTRKYR